MGYRHLSHTATGGTFIPATPPQLVHNMRDKALTVHYVVGIPTLRSQMHLNGCNPAILVDVTAIIHAHS